MKHVHPVEFYFCLLETKPKWKVDRIKMSLQRFNLKEITTWREAPGNIMNLAWASLAQRWIIRKQREMAIFLNTYHNTNILSIGAYLLLPLPSQPFCKVAILLSPCYIWLNWVIKKEERLGKAYSYLHLGFPSRLPTLKGNTAVVKFIPEWTLTLSQRL